MAHLARFTFSTPTASLLYRALAPELIDQEGMRSTVDLACVDQTTLVMTVEADDLAALRAALNMWLRLVNVADEVTEMGLANYDSGQAVRS
jgi:KEOPS complex subunit Pcc1